MDAPRLLLALPRKACRYLAVDDLGEILGHVLLGKGVGIVDGRAQTLVDGADDLAERVVARPAAVVALPVPAAARARIAVDLVYLVGCVGVTLREPRDRGREHLVGHGERAPEEALHEARLAMRGIVTGKLDHHGAADVTKRLRTVAPQTAHMRSVARQYVERAVHGLFLRAGIPAGSRFCPALARCLLGCYGPWRRGLAFEQRKRRAERGRYRLALPGSDAVGERHEGLVERDVNVRSEQRAVEPVPDGVVAKPQADVAVDVRVVDAIVLPEPLDGLESLHARRHADAAEQLIEIHEDEGERRATYLAGAHLRAPREVPAQLTVAHGLVGWEVLVERPAVGHVVLVILHHACLLVEDPCRGLAACLR